VIDMQLPDGFEAWQAWLGLAVLLVVLELFSLDLVLLMLAAGAVAGMVADLLGAADWLQALVAVATSVAALGLVRPTVVKRLHSGPTLQMSHERMVGQEAVVVQQVSAQAGLVRVAGELWSARSYDHDQVIEVGHTVEVFQVTGASVLVHETPALD
jgi:membrane protein implicated in regulation of membrane protease activity